MKIFLPLLAISLATVSCVSESGPDDFEIPEIPNGADHEMSDEWIDKIYSIDQTSEGLKCEDIFLTKGGKKIESNVIFGEQIRMNFSEIKGLEFPNGKCEVDMMFLFTNLEGDTLDYYPFGSIPPIVDSNKVQTHPELSTYCFVVSPTYSGSSYYFTSGLKDVTNGRTVYGKTKLNVKANENIHIDSEGLSCKEGFVYDPIDNFYVTNNVITKGRDYDFAILGVSGFTLKGDYANIGIKLKMTDLNNEDPFDSGDLLLSNNGKVKFSDINELLSIDFQVAEEFNQNTIHVEIEVWDKNSDSKLSYWSDFIIAAS